AAGVGGGDRRRRAPRRRRSSTGAEQHRRRRDQPAPTHARRSVPRPDGRGTRDRRKEVGMTAITAPARGASLFGASAAVARRTIRKFMRSPQLVVVGTIQGAMFLVIFRYVFGGAIHTGSVPYVDFLVPGFVTTSVLFAGMMTAAGVAEDLDQGFVDRLRSLPIPRASVLAG